MGPHPYPWMVREFHRVIGDEAREQCRALLGGADPDVVVACVGGGSNAAGIFCGLRRAARRRAGRRRAGRRRRRRPRRARRRARDGVVPACRTTSGRCRRPSRSRPGSTTRASDPSTPTSPTSAGPATSRSPTPRCSTPSSCWPAPRGSSRRSSRPTPSPGWSRAARSGELAGKVVLVNLSGRGDKDVAQVADLLGDRYARVTGGAAAARGDAAGRAATPGRKLLVPYVTGGMADDWTDVAAGHGRRRRRRHRGRHPVLRPGDGRPDHPGGVGAGAAPGARRRRRSSTELRGVDAGVPLVVMTYYNLVFRPGEARFARWLADAGVSGAIVPDVPLEESGPVVRRRPTPPGIETVLLAAPTASDERLARICERARGLRLRRVAARRDRGAGVAVGRRPGSIAKRLKAITDKPVIVGIGISTPRAGRRGVRGRRRRRRRRLGDHAPPARRRGPRGRRRRRRRAPRRPRPRLTRTPSRSCSCSRRSGAV